jgi:hypothetical protein
VQDAGKSLDLFPEVPHRLASVNQVASISKLNERIVVKKVPAVE